ncbi:hypothetical protein MnTg02_01765 [bacterium MnTg02]|nr:hypothetical protein MnTg02_01765 [bacterium MnTg02]
MPGLPNAVSYRVVQICNLRCDGCENASQTHVGCANYRDHNQRKQYHDAAGNPKVVEKILRNEAPDQAGQRKANGAATARGHFRDGEDDRGVNRKGKQVTNDPQRPRKSDAAQKIPSCQKNDDRKHEGRVAETELNQRMRNVNAGDSQLVVDFAIREVARLFLRIIGCQTDENQDREHHQKDAEDFLFSGIVRILFLSHRATVLDRSLLF